MRIVILTRQAGVLAAAGALAALGLSGAATASVTVQRPFGAHPSFPRPAVLARHFARPALPPGEHYVCPAPTKPGQMACMSIVRTGSVLASPAIPGVSNGNYGPSDLRSAYKLTTASRTGGRGRLVAIVDAFNNPNLARDLATYRSHFGLPPCGTASGCLKIVNQKGQRTPLPRADKGWGLEESLDLDMVSAICPNCHILLVEANSPTSTNLGTAVNRAVSMGAKYVSNSWSGGEFIGQDFFDHFFNHPGVAIDFASGDFGYGPQYPTDLQYVTAVGGTTLKHASSGRGWSESVWGVATRPEGTGSGCSALSAKASWQRADATSPNGCLNRTENDVAAVANPATGVYVVDTYKFPGHIVVGGTSAATPIITGVYALAGVPTAHTYPAMYPYLHSSRLFDVTSGVNGMCESFRQYLCHGKLHYDGPTGLGTPNGTGAFTDGGAHRVTVVDPGTIDAPVGVTGSRTITGLDTRSVTSLKWGATGLPPGLTIKAKPNSTKGIISGTLPGTGGDFAVTVTAKDGTVTGTTHFDFTVVPSVSQPAAASGEVSLNSFGTCLDSTGGGSGTLVKADTCTGASSQLWKYTSDGGPDSIGSFSIGGLCLDVNGSNKAVLASCNPTSATQAFVYLGFGVLGNLGTGKCLNAPTTAGSQAGVASCNFGPSQTWWLPAGPIVAGTGLCLDNSSNLEVATCAGTAEQQWSLNGDGTISSNLGQCLTGNGSLLSDGLIVAGTCDPANPTDLWIPGPGGELINAASGRCLADPGNGGSGTIVRQEDCYGQLGEVWGLN